jgi:acyl-CoA thioester hydrolase
MITECTLAVRTYECDRYGHVNNANYLNYLEYARCEYLRAIGFDYPALIEAGYGLYVVRIEIDYKKPARADDALCIRTRALDKGAVKGVLAQDIWRGDELIASAKAVWACVDASGRPSRLPSRWDVPGLKPEPALPAAL